MSEIRKQVGQLIKATRKQQGLTQKELGERLSLSEGAVNRYESGDRNLSIEVLYKIACTMDLKLDISFKKH